MMPPFRWHYVGDAWKAGRSLLELVLRVGPKTVGTGASVGAPQNLDRMVRMTRSETNLFPGQFSKDDLERVAKSERLISKRKVVRTLSRIHQAVTTAGLALALAVTLVLGWRWFTQPLGVLAFALLGSVVVRVALLSFLEVTSIPSINLLYFTPAYPLLLAYVAIALWLGGVALLNRVRERFGDRDAHS